MNNYRVTLSVSLTMVVRANGEDDALVEALGIIERTFPDSNFIDWRYIEETEEDPTHV